MKSAELKFMRLKNKAMEHKLLLWNCMIFLWNVILTYSETLVYYQAKLLTETNSGVEKKKKN